MSLSLPVRRADSLRVLGTLSPIEPFNVQRSGAASIQPVWHGPVLFTVTDPPYFHIVLLPPFSRLYCSRGRQLYAWGPVIAIAYRCSLLFTTSLGFVLLPCLRLRLVVLDEADAILNASGHCLRRFLRETTPHLCHYTEGLC